MVNQVIPLVLHHMDHLTVSTPTEVRDLAVQLKPTSIHDLGYVIEADHSGRPPFPARQPKEMEEILHIAESLGCLDGPQLPLLTGQMIVDRNIPEGEAVGVIFRAVYQAQIQGTISTKEQAIEWFFRNRRQILENAKLAPKKLIQATELMAIGIKPGPTLGKILNELYELQLDGKLKTREEAAENLREILRRIKIQEQD
jgi:hypothetical protein